MFLIKKQNFNRFRSRNFVNPTPNNSKPSPNPQPSNPNLQLVVDLRGTKAVLPPRVKKGSYQIAYKMIVAGIDFQEVPLRSNSSRAMLHCRNLRKPLHSCSPYCLPIGGMYILESWGRCSQRKSSTNRICRLTLICRDAEVSETSDIVKPIVSDLVEYLATQDLTYTGHILYYFLSKFGRMFLEVRLGLIHC